METSTIGIIGAGNMGASLVAGLMAHNFPANQLWVTDPDPAKLQILQEQFGLQTTADNEKVVELVDVLVLAVKPQVMATVVRKLAKKVQNKQPLIISIAAGIREENLQQWLGNNIAIIRCMPNMPALIRAGITALYANRFVSKEQHILAETILRAVGMTVWLQDENEMDAVTALSGSGPAYFFFIMEAMQAAGEKLGLAPETARLLTLRTALGAAQMALASDKTPTELRQQVTSPGGTTEAAVRVLQEAKITEIFTHALTKACARSKELAKLSGEENNE